MPGGVVKWGIAPGGAIRRRKTFTEQNADYIGIPAEHGEIHRGHFGFMTCSTLRICTVANQTPYNLRAPSPCGATQRRFSVKCGRRPNFRIDSSIKQHCYTVITLALDGLVENRRRKAFGT
jgi:hypothetical protein